MPATPPIRVLLIAPALRITGGQAVQADWLLSEISGEPSVAMDFMAIAPVLPRPFRWLQSIRYVRTVVTFLAYLPLVLWRTPRYEILHVFSASYWSYAMWSMTPMLLGKLLGKKVVLHYHSGEAEDHLTRWRSAAPTIRLADAIISPSESLIGVFARFGIKAECIYNFIDPSQFRYRERRQIRPAFFHNRGFEPLYNVQCTLRAFAIIQRKYPDASLTLAHDGSLRRDLESLAGELGLRNVKFVGRVSQAEMVNLYDSADIYLMSPDLDCMPVSLLECFASGLPLVSTNPGGVPYIVRDGETGLLVNCNDHEGMAALAIRLLEEHGLAERLARAGREELKKYRRETVRAQWVALYRGLAGR
jgi:glycosyltransferase involved in cell wall biosynthesis